MSANMNVKPRRCPWVTGDCAPEDRITTLSLLQDWGELARTPVPLVNMYAQESQFVEDVKTIVQRLVAISDEQYKVNGYTPPDDKTWLIGSQQTLVGYLNSIIANQLRHFVLFLRAKHAKIETVRMVPVAIPLDSSGRPIG